MFVGIKFYFIRILFFDDFQEKFSVIYSFMRGVVFGKRFYFAFFGERGIFYAVLRPETAGTRFKGGILYDVFFVFGRTEEQY